jgi:hypothetical protein
MKVRVPQWCSGYRHKSFEFGEARAANGHIAHSSTASSGQWQDLIKRMSGRYRLVAPDHIGYGRTAAYSGPVDGAQKLVERLGVAAETAFPIHASQRRYHLE